jgi:hypothetical protein
VAKGTTNVGAKGTAMGRAKGKMIFKSFNFKNFNTLN